VALSKGGKERVVQTPPLPPPGDVCVLRVRERETGRSPPPLPPTHSRMLSLRKDQYRYTRCNHTDPRTEPPYSTRECANAHTNVVGLNKLKGTERTGLHSQNWKLNVLHAGWTPSHPRVETHPIRNRTCSRPPPTPGVSRSPILALPTRRQQSFHGKPAGKPKARKC
jgi:hypothetical protein